MFNIRLNLISRCLIACNLVCLLIMAGCTPKLRLESTTDKYYRMDVQVVKVDSAMLNEIEPYKTRIDEELSTVIGTADHDLEKSTPEGALGNMAADACLHAARLRDSSSARVDFCFLNNGGLRNSIPKGPITRNKIFELMPFENELVVLTLSGETTMKLFNVMASKGGMPISGASYRVANDRADSVSIGNVMIDTTKTYRITTSDYLAGGGENLSFLALSSEKKYLNVKVRDAIMQYIINEQSKGRTIHTTKDGRVTKK